MCVNESFRILLQYILHYFEVYEFEYVNQREYYEYFKPQNTKNACNIN